MTITKQLLIGTILTLAVNTLYIGGTLVLGDYKDYRKARGMLDYKVFTMGNPAAIETYEETFYSIIEEHKDHVLCSHHIYN